MAEHRPALTASMFGALQAAVADACAGEHIPHEALRIIAHHLLHNTTQDGHIPPRRWVARLAGPIQDLRFGAHLDLYDALEGILEASLPLLAALRRPALLLPGPLQVVTKIQGVFLRDDDDEYSGVWHRDGHRENIVAVVLYYYRCSDSIAGGALEFLDKRQAGSTEHSTAWDDNKRAWADARWGSQDTRMLLDATPHGSVAVPEKTLVAFSNQQMIHRVLRMTHRDPDEGSPPHRSNSGNEKAGRDFVAFFVVDQRAPLPMASELPSGHWRGGPITSQATRACLLREQLLPSGKFGVTPSGICSTGNGSFAMVGWLNYQRNTLNTELPNYSSSSSDCSSEDRASVPLRHQIAELNATPPLGRTVSWAASPRTLESILQSVTEKRLERRRER
eukprot:COSAG01_NODE_155_length_23814_cov_12.061343_15_plen_392_part_00